LIHREKRPILYVDDTVEQRYAMRRILETEGFRVLEAGTGKEALALADATLALAVVDVKLPDISGYDLSRKLKEIEPHLPILQVSASFSDPDLRAAGFSGGADAYIAQPVHPGELTALVQRMLRASEAEESLRFLAAIGPQITASLSIQDTAQNIRRALMPVFADRCDIYLRAVAGRPQLFGGEIRRLNDVEDLEMETHTSEVAVRKSSSNKIIAPLVIKGECIGAIRFEVNEARTYTSSDFLLASDISARAALALQNCMLFAAEQITRSALIQSEKLATAGRMAAAMAHEINNPLEALTNLIYIIEQSPDASLSIRETASAALSEVTRLAHITRQSLGFYKELRAPSKLDLSESVRETVELYRKRIDQHQIELTLELAHELIVQGIKGELRQVISNLLVNAIEAVPAGGKINVTTFSNAGRVFLEMTDNGSGIDEKVRDHILEPFFTTKPGTGTGLGLWITQSILEKHGGAIRVCMSGVTSGTKFQVELPIDSA